MRVKIVTKLYRNSDSHHNTQDTVKFSNFRVGYVLTVERVFIFSLFLIYLKHVVNYAPVLVLARLMVIHL